ncbi:MAG: class I SAM-dependent rRNA methyltransferase [bacterium]|nr:class I SAM-dependent rRNA methyltransferase [bacterium]
MNDAESVPVVLSGVEMVKLKAGADKRIRDGHSWIFSNELVDGFQSYESGRPVQVVDHKGKLIGVGTVNPHSLIAVRLFCRERVEIGQAFLRQRIARAVALRERLLPGERVCRLIYGESDGLPGLIVDRYGDVLVVQSGTAGMDRLLPIVTNLLVESFSPRAIVMANDASVRELEGIRLYREVAWGSLGGPVAVEQDGLRFLVDPLHGQKTGLFLDQRWSRLLLASFIRPGDRVLDLFCYSGGFGLYALKAGAAHVTFVDSSQAALDMAAENSRLNGFGERISLVKADVFEFVKSPSERFDAVVLDPPALAKGRKNVPAALRGYRDLNARAMVWANNGGILATASCSGLVHVDSWLDSLREAAQKAQKTLRFIARGGQSPDHPVLASMPETEYLKFAIGVIE